MNHRKHGNQVMNHDHHGKNMAAIPLSWHDHDHVSPCSWQDHGTAAMFCQPGTTPDTNIKCKKDKYKSRLRKWSIVQFKSFILKHLFKEMFFF